MPAADVTSQCWACSRVSTHIGCPLGPVISHGLGLEGDWEVRVRVMVRVCSAVNARTVRNVRTFLSTKNDKDSRNLMKSEPLGRLEIQFEFRPFFPILAVKKPFSTRRFFMKYIFNFI